MNVNKSSLQGPVNLHIFYNFLNGRVAVLVAQISRSLDGTPIDSLTEGIHWKYFKGHFVFLLNILSAPCWLIMLIECISLEVLTDRTAIPGHPSQSQGRLGTGDNSAQPRMVRGEGGRGRNGGKYN